MDFINREDSFLSFISFPFEIRVMSNLYLFGLTAVLQDVPLISSVDIAQKREGLCAIFSIIPFDLVYRLDIIIYIVYLHIMK